MGVWESEDGRQRSDNLKSEIKSQRSELSFVFLAFSRGKTPILLILLSCQNSTHRPARSAIAPYLCVLFFWPVLANLFLK